MARLKGLSDTEHDQVSAAVTQAEMGTNGEIVTIVSESSDPYRDVALHYAVAAMLLPIGLFAWAPEVVQNKIAWLSQAWTAEAGISQLLLALFVTEAILFLVVRYALAPLSFRLALAPQSTKRRRVRRRALLCFKVGAERRTANRVGVLLYMSLGEHMAEIVADAAIHAKVPPERWGDAMAALVEHVRAGRSGDGMAAAVAAIGAIIGEHFPKTDDDLNELPDRLIEL
ncbi:MAG: hypothetical protein ACKVOB_01965 [Sphingomonas sp.]